MTRLTGLGWRCLALGAALLLALSLVGAFMWSTQCDDAPDASRCVQAPFYALAAWLS